METVHHQTAGGVVFDQEGRLLTLVRDIEREGVLRHEVRLPKGHIEPGETSEEAALREVCEESGYCGLTVLADLGHMESRYVFEGILRIRDEHYYLMRSDGVHQAPMPVGPEEALFEVHWLERWEAVQALTYPSEREFAQRGVTAFEKGAGRSCNGGTD